MKIVCAWMYAIGRYGFPPAIPDVLAAIREMKEMGFEYIEVEGIGYDNIAQVVAHRREIRELCNSEGLKVANFAVLLPDIISQKAKTRSKAFDYFRRGIDTASFLGSPYAWIDSYFPPLELRSGIAPSEGLVYGQAFRVSVPDGFDWRRFWDSFVESVRRANEMAKKNNVRLLLEPRVGEVVANSDAMLRLIEAVGDDNFGVILDIGHQHAQKELLPLSIEKLGRHMKYVHVADNDGRDNRHFPPGEGNVDWDALFQLLKRRRFDGFFSTDLEKIPDLSAQFVRTRRFLEENAARYGL